MNSSIKSSDQHVVSQIISWLNKDEHVVLFTVAQTWGSSPRPVGSLLAISENGELIGSVSGGCIEDDLIQRVNSGEFHNTQSRLIEYGINGDQAKNFGLPCGGKITLLVEPNLQLAQFENILNKIEDRSSLSRRVCLKTGEVSLHNDTVPIFFFDENNVRKVFGPVWRILIIGAGELAHYVCELSSMLNYEIHICDPRENYIKSWNIDKVTVNKNMPDDVVTSLRPDQTTAIVTLTHDPKLDDMALLEALKSDAFYIGSLGSKKTNAARRKRLLKMDLNQQQIEKLHGPVGLDIGSHTPAEIAISIMAEITAVRNNKHLENTK
jgi:xanthine dehydrogenase accessory factor